MVVEIFLQSGHRSSEAKADQQPFLSVCLREERLMPAASQLARGWLGSFLPCALSSPQVSYRALSPDRAHVPGSVLRKSRSARLQAAFPLDQVFILPPVALGESSEVGHILFVLLCMKNQDSRLFF